MKSHTTIGAKLLEGSNSPVMQAAREIALTHHEKWDGTGYPDGLKRDDIPIMGQVCSICDVFDALTSRRPYKEAWPIGQAVKEIDGQKDRHFSARLVEGFHAVFPLVEKIHAGYGDVSFRSADNP